MSSDEDESDYTDEDWESGSETDRGSASGSERSETGSEESESEWGSQDETDHSESEYSDYTDATHSGDETETESESGEESGDESERRSMQMSTSPAYGRAGGSVSNPLKQRGNLHRSHKGHVKTIFIYRNGDAFFPARKVVFGYKIRTFIYLLEWVTEALHPPFGAVRKLFDMATGKEVHDLHDVVDQGEYVAGPGHKKYAKLKYSSIVDYATKQRTYRPPDLSRSRMKSKMKQVEGRNEVEHPMTLFILANRDKDGIPTKVILMRRDRQNGMQHILDIITKKLGYHKLPASAKKLFDLKTRKPIKKLNQLYDQGFFVAIDRIEAVRLPPFDPVGGELVRRTDLPHIPFKNKPIMFDRRITGKTDVGERRLDKLLEMGFESEVGRVQLKARPPPKFLPGLGRHTGMKRTSEMRSKKKKRDGAYADDPLEFGGSRLSSRAGGGTEGQPPAGKGDRAIWDFIHYDLIDQLIVPLVEEALKEHQQKLFTLLNDYVVTRATTIKQNMGSIPFAKDMPALPSLNDLPSMTMGQEDRPLGGTKKKRRPGSGSSKASRASRRSNRSRKSHTSKASKASKMSKASKALSVQKEAGDEPGLEREGTTFLGDEGPQVESPEKSKAKKEPQPKETPQSVDELAPMIVDYMLRPSADFFAEDATEADKQTASRFTDVMTMAIDGKLAHWEDDPLMLVALVIALDQFTRTIYKGTKREYEGEEMLQRVLKRAVEETGVIQDVAPMHMWFCCLALSHQEDTHSQKLGQQLWSSVKVKFAANDPIHKFEKKFNNNAKIVEKFSRFPQRNEKLGRQPTEEESEFLETHAKRQAKKQISQVSVNVTDADSSPEKAKKRGSKIGKMFGLASKKRNSVQVSA